MNRINGRIKLTAAAVAACAAYFVYMYYVVDPSLYLIRGYREFFTDVYFLRRVTGFPGGVAEYVSRFLVHVCRYPAAGAAVVAALAGGVYVLGVRACGGRWPAAGVRACVATVAVVLMHGDYRHGMRFDVDAVCILAWIALYRRVSARRAAGAAVFPLVLAGALWVNGFMAAAVVAAVALTVAAVERRDGVAAAGVAAATVAVAAAGRFGFDLSVHDVAQEVSDAGRVYSFRYFPFLLYTGIFIQNFKFKNQELDNNTETRRARRENTPRVLPLSVLRASVLKKIKAPGMEDIQDSKFKIQDSDNNTETRRARRGRTRGVFSLSVLRASVLKKNSPFIILLCALAASFALSDGDTKHGLAVQQCAIGGRWEEALRHARQCAYPDLDVVLCTNEALHRTGRICDELFRYNQSFGSEGLMSVEVGNYSGIMPNQDIFMRLGALSLSIVWGTEATNVYGANPYVLRNLVKASLAAGRIAEARKVLNLLERTPFEGAWAARYRTLADDTARIALDAELGACRRAQAPAADVSTQSVVMNLYLLAREAKANRMAYDYLLIATLLDHRPEYFASYASGLRDYGYTAIPKLYLEGLIYYSLYGGEMPVDVREFAFDATVLDRFEAFRRDLIVAARRPEGMKAALADGYADTYWYYLLFSSRLTDGEKMAVFERITM